MFCTYCGKQNPEDASFCTDCGKALKINVSSVPVAENVSAEMPNVEETTVEVPVAENVSAEMPNVEETTVEVPVAENVSTEIPNVEETTAEAPVAENVGTEIPNVEETTVEVPVAENVNVETPIVEEIAVEAPSVENVSNVAPSAEEVPAETVLKNDENVKKDKHIDKKSKKMQNSKEGSGSKVFSCVLSGFLSFFLMLFLVVVSAFCVIRFSLNEKNIEDTIKKMSDVGGFISEIPTLGDDQSFLQTICDEINEHTDIYREVTPDEIESLIKDTDIKDLISEKVGSVVSSFGQGDAKIKITADEIVDFVKNNEDVIEETLGCTITSKDYDDLEKIEIEAFSAEDIGVNLSVLSFLSGTAALIISFAVVLIFAILIFITNGVKKISSSFSCISTSFLVVSQIFFFALAFILSIVLTSTYSLAVFAASAIIEVLALVTGSLTGMGILMRIVSCIIKRVKRRGLSQ